MVDENLASHPICKLILDGTVTSDDFNNLIETTFKSMRERVRRTTEPLDHNRRNDDEGHSLTAGPNFNARTAKRPGGGAMNDPRKTGRGRAMLRRQATKHKSKPNNVSESIADKTCPECKCAAINTDDTARCWCNDCGYVWKTEKTEKADKPTDKLDENKEYPKAKFHIARQYNPICPHCGETMSEKSVRPDAESLLARMEQLQQLSKTQLWEMMHGASDPPGVNKPLYRHTKCYDKGPFEIHWPTTEFSEAANFIINKQGSVVTESDLSTVRDRAKLSRLATRLLREDGLNRDWLWDLSRRCISE